MMDKDDILILLGYALDAKGILMRVIDQIKEDKQ